MITAAFLEIGYFSTIMPPLLKTLTIALLSLINFQAFAQNIDTPQVSISDCPEYNSLRAQADIKKGRALIFLCGGSIVTFINEKKLSKRYHITFANKGCIAPASKICMFAYNQVVFEYLDKTFGIGWRKEVRKDVLGFPGYDHGYD